MSSPLQKSPLGLLGQFDMKVGGDNPNLFGETLVPTVDVTGQYGALLQTTLGNSDLVQNYGDGVVLNVPQNEVWRVMACHAIIGMGPGIFTVPTVITIGYKPPGQLGVVILGHSARPAITTASLTQVVANWAGTPFFAPPGSRFEGFLLGGMPNANAMTVQVLYERIVP